MSKKNLARTAIEGGRANKYERRTSSQVERVRVRALLRAAVFDDELPDRRALPRRLPVRPEFHDKLNPLKKWIVSQSGRRWDDVWSELHGMFDVRKTSGRHLLYDHAVYYVNFAWEPRRRYAFYEALGGNLVGLDGVLRHTPRKWPYGPAVRPTRSDQALWAWAGGRLVRRVGSVLFWFVPTRPLGSFRQDRRLTAAEVAEYDSLNHLEQAKLG
jgi:hypothetical protein